MDKNTIICFVLIAAVLIGFSWWSRPSEEEIAQKRMQDSITAVAKQKAEQKLKAEQEAEKANAANKAVEDTTVAFYKALNGKAQSVVLKNSKVELTLNTKGGVVEKAVIKGFKSNSGNNDLTLFDGKNQSLKFMLAGKETNIITSDLFFTPSNVTDSTVTMTADAGNGKSLVMNYRLGKDYMLHFSMQANGLSGMFAPNYDKMDIEWTDLCRQQEKGFTFENQHSSLTYHLTEGGTDNLSETSEKVDEKIEDVIDWVAFKNQFFSAVMIAKDDFGANSLMTSIPQEKGSGFLKHYAAKMKTSFDPTGKTPTELEFYFGPNDFNLLKKVEKQSTFNKDLELQRLVYLGWPLFRIINRWFTIYVFDWLTGMNINMGIVLILITLLLKVITYPLVKKSYMSSAKMRVLRPKIEEATKQYDKPEDQMQKQQAMMALYQRAGISPMGGCLPMLLQLPILYAMFRFFPASIELRQQHFLWADDLSAYDSILDLPFRIPLYGDHVSLFALLMAISMFLYSKMTSSQMSNDPNMAGMKFMSVWLMPVMMLFICNNLSSGLSYYYLLSNLITMFQTWFVRRFLIDEKKIHAQLAASAGKPLPKSKWQQRLEEAQKMQQQALKEQQKRRR